MSFVLSVNYVELWNRCLFPAIKPWQQYLFYISVYVYVYIAVYVYVYVY